MRLMQIPPCRFRLLKVVPLKDGQKAKKTTLSRPYDDTQLGAPMHFLVDFGWEGCYNWSCGSHRGPFLGE